MRLPFRIKLAIQLAKLGPLGQSWGLSLMTVNDLTVWNQYYAEQVARKRQINQAEPELELSDEEANCVKSLFQQPGNALILGCGEGREALGLASEGWHVSGIDHSKRLILAAELTAKERGLSIDFFCRNIAVGLPHFIEPFHLITLLGQVYQYIPTRERRIALLRECHERLAPDGYIMMTTPMIQTVFEHEAKEPLRLAAFAKLFRGYRNREIGDHWEPKREFHHKHSSRHHFEQEIKEAGYQYCASSPSDSLTILRPINKETPQRNPVESIK